MKPEVQHIAITVADGSLAIMQFVTNDGRQTREATDEAITEEIERAGIKAMAWRRISPEDIPANRTDRDAWADTGKAITVDPVRKAALERAKPRDLAAEVDALKVALAANPALDGLI